MLGTNTPQDAVFPTSHESQGSHLQNTRRYDFMNSCILFDNSLLMTNRSLKIVITYKIPVMNIIKTEYYIINPTESIYFISYTS